MKNRSTFPLVNEVLTNRWPKAFVCVQMANGLTTFTGCKIKLKKKSEWKASLSAIVSLRFQSAAHFEIKRFFLFLEIAYKLKLTCSVDQHFKILPREIEYRFHCLHVTGTMSLKSQWSYPVSLFSFLPYFLHVFQPVPIHSSQFVRQQAVAIAVLVQFPEKISALQKTLSKIFRFGTHQIWLSIAEFWRGNQATPSWVLAQMIFRDYLVLVYMSKLSKGSRALQ